MNLRSYQQEAVDAIASAFVIKGRRRSLMVLPTASGKTVIFSELPKYFDGQILVLAHRKELIVQAAQKMLAANPYLHVAIEMADQRARHTADIIVGSIQTLARPKRREKFERSAFSLVIVDEAHHVARGGAYAKVLDDLGCFREGGPCLLGVTATPYRTSGESLGHFFEHVVYEKSLIEMIDEGWVSPLRAYQVRTHTSLDGVGTCRGDFKENELSQRVNNDTRNLEVVRSWERLAGDRHSCLVFAVDVAHAKGLVEAFRAAGYSTDCVFGQTDDSERRAVFKRFLARESRILVNVGVATEGTDLPPVDTILLARPTKSSLLMTQMVGRGLRLYEGKADCLIIDMVDNCSKGHKISTSATVLGMPANVNPKGQDLRLIKPKLTEFQKEFPKFKLPLEITLGWIEKQRARMRELMLRSRTDVRATQVSLFGAPGPSAALSEAKWAGPPTPRQAWRLKRLGHDPDRMTFRQAWQAIRRAEAIRNAS